MNDNRSEGVQQKQQKVNWWSQGAGETQQTQGLNRHLFADQKRMCSIQTNMMIYDDSTSKSGLKEFDWIDTSWQTYDLLQRDPLEIRGFYGFLHFLPILTI